MRKQSKLPVYSGASPEKVAADLEPLVDFQEEGLSLKTLQRLIEERLLPHLMRYDCPEFQSMFNFFPEEGAEFGAKIALRFNQGVTNWQVSPGGAMLEELCAKALCRLFGLAPGADATFMYSGTYANQEALYLALHRRAEKQGFDFTRKGLKGFPEPARLTVIASRDAHFSLQHAVRILGLGEESLITLDVDHNRRIDVSLIEQKLSEIKEKRDVFCAVATTGTTSTGSVDPIPPLAEACKKLGAWLHVDGAYGLAYSLVPEWKPLFTGLELADSVSWDPHKQFGVPIPSSLLFVCQGKDFERLALCADYFNPEGQGEPNPGLKSPPSTRPLSALSLVTSLRSQGLKKVIKRLRLPLEAIKTLAEKLREKEDIELCHQPDTGILCFRIIPQGFPEYKLCHLQRKIYERIMTEGKRTISLTKLDDKTVMRLVAVSPAVSADSMLETISCVRRLAVEYQK